jgi:hypothetical protein
MKLALCIITAALCGQVALANSNADAKCIPPMPEGSGSSQTVRCVPPPVEVVLATCSSNSDSPTGSFWSVVVSEFVQPSPMPPAPLPFPIPEDGLTKKHPGRWVNVSISHLGSDDGVTALFGGILQETSQNMRIKFGEGMPSHGRLGIRWFQSDEPTSSDGGGSTSSDDGSTSSDDPSQPSDNYWFGKGKLHMEEYNGATSVELSCQRGAVSL